MATRDAASEAIASHYEVLGLTPELLADQADPSSLLKRAYHRALLRNHPDKGKDSAAPLFTVDQIKLALSVLLSPQQRTAYDATLRLSQDDEASSLRRFQTGVFDVDLEDLEYDEGAEIWHRACRCGNDRAYVFREEDLVEAGDEGEIMVPCLDCSLWLRVHFAMVEESAG